MRIKIISTGGTIGSFSDDRGIRLFSKDERVIDRLIAERPSWAPAADISTVYPFSLLSENMIPDDWIRIARQVLAEIRDGADAIIVTHGTDTMAYSIAACAFMLSKIPIPIVFTGALYPYGHEKSDGHQNLWDSILFCTKNQYAGVYLAFGAPGRKNMTSVYWGPRIQSIRPFGSAFETIDNKQVAWISKEGNIKFLRDPLKLNKRVVSDITINDSLDRRIAVYKVYPGFEPKNLLEVSDSSVRAIILDLYHSGTGSTRDHYSLGPVIQELLTRNIAVFGAGAPLRQEVQYKSTSSLVSSGMRPLGMMSLEAAIVKTMCLLGRYPESINIIRKKVSEAILGEIVE